MRVHLSTSYHPQTERQSERNIHTLEDMLRACVIEYGGSLDTHLQLVQFAYKNTYHFSIDMAHYEMLYGRKCQTPTCWIELGENQFARSEIVQIIVDKVKVVRDRLQVAREIQKKYSDKKHRPKTFEVGEKVMLKVSPWKGIIRFGKRGKLGARFIGLFSVLEHIRE